MQHKRSANRLTAGKYSLSEINHSSIDLKRANSQSEIKLKIMEIGEGINVSVKKIPSLKEDVRKSVDNVYTIRNRSKFTSHRNTFVSSL